MPALTCRKERSQWFLIFLHILVYLLKKGGARENLFSRAGNQGNFWQNADVSLYNVQSNDEVGDS